MSEEKKNQKEALVATEGGARSGAIRSEAPTGFV